MGTENAMLAATQAQFPNYRLSLVSGIEAHNNFVRFSWAAGGTADRAAAGGPAAATLFGIDAGERNFVRVRMGR